MCLATSNFIVAHGKYQLKLFPNTFDNHGFHIADYLFGVFQGKNTKLTTYVYTFKKTFPCCLVNQSGE